MNPLLIGPILEIGKTMLDKFFPNEEDRRKAEAQFLKDAMDGELKQVIAQLEINAREAAHPSIFVAGWRPAYGWSGVLGFLYAVIGQPILAWYCRKEQLPTPPEINIDLLWVVITGLLGIGGLRTYEKSKQVTK